MGEAPQYAALAERHAAEKRWLEAEAGFSRAIELHALDDMTVLLDLAQQFETDAPGRSSKKLLAAALIRSGRGKEAIPVLQAHGEEQGLAQYLRAMALHSDGDESGARKSSRRLRSGTACELISHTSPRSD